MCLLRKGFTLIEILITLAIISLLAFISVPIYSHYIVQEKRLEAANALSKLALNMEQYHLEHDTYQQATLATLHLPEIIAGDRYRLAIESNTDTFYTLIAKPLDDQAKRDTQCGTLTLNAHGEKGITGLGTVEACW